MAYGDPWPPTLWGGTASSGQSITLVPTWYSNSTGFTQQVHTWAEETIAEKVESAMDWLRRRVTEITDLAYAEV